MCITSLPKIYPEKSDREIEWSYRDIRGRISEKEVMRMMKILIILFMIIAVCAGCGSLAKESEFWQHDSHFKNWEHMKFSLWGYKNCTDETAKKSMEQG